MLGFDRKLYSLNDSALRLAVESAILTVLKSRKARSQDNGRKLIGCVCLNVLKPIIECF